LGGSPQIWTWLDLDRNRRLVVKPMVKECTLRGRVWETPKSGLDLTWTEIVWAPFTFLVTYERSCTIAHCWRLSSLPTPPKHRHSAICQPPSHPPHPHCGWWGGWVGAYAVWWWVWVWSWRWVGGSLECPPCLRPPSALFSPSQADPAETLSSVQCVA